MPQPEPCTDVYLWCPKSNLHAPFDANPSSPVPHVWGEPKCIPVTDQPKPDGYELYCSPMMTIGGICVMDALVSVGSILAVILGVYYYNKVRRNFTVIPNAFAFARTYLLFAIMMGLGCITHCFNYILDSTWRLLVGVQVVGLTATIAIGFGIAALVNAGLLSDQSRAPFVLLSLTWVTFTVIDTLVMLGYLQASLMAIYVGPILIGCGSFAIQLLVRILRERNVAALAWCIAAVVAGYGGLTAAVDLPAYMCANFPAWFSPQGVWYIASDVSMFCLYKAYVSRGGVRGKTVYTSAAAVPLMAQADDDEAAI